MTGDDKIVSLSERLARPQALERPRPADLNCDRIRELSVKAVIYPQTITSNEAQELGSAILSHLKRYHGYVDRT